jgi:transcriptional regulator GlxA family with amidase domain
MDARVQTVIDLMHRSISDRISLSALSKHVNLTSTRLRQLFKQQTGHTPMQYLRDLRFQRAKELLGSTFLTIKEVSFMSGARNSSHFMREFKKQSGFTPTEFRNLVKAGTKDSVRDNNESK